MLGVGTEYVAIDFEKVNVAVGANSDHRIVVDLDANQLAEQQEVTPDDYPELRLETVLQKIAGK